MDTNINSMYIPNQLVKSNISYKLHERRVILVPTTVKGTGGYHHSDSDALYAVEGGNTGHASSVITSISLSHTALTRSTDDMNFCRVSLTTYLNLLSHPPMPQRYLYTQVSFSTFIFVSSIYTVL